ncbi:MAG: holo-[acyl-carrier-protein] synthase [Ignavibacteria bacterium]|nr:holo-[acyl-carrier-protein] synthase [Ignavibacteria bacterium]
MVRGTGIDIIEIKRIKKIIEKYGDKFFNRILTEKEIEYCKSFSKPELHFAGRFASKEAYSKAIGTGISKDFGWKDIEILNDKRGKPYICHTKQNDFSGYKFNVSISHTEEYACAVVVCED